MAEHSWALVLPWVGDALVLFTCRIPGRGAFRKVFRGAADSARRTILPANGRLGAQAQLSATSQTPGLLTL